MKVYDTGDRFVDLLLTSGISESTMRRIEADIRKATQGLSREELFARANAINSIWQGVCQG